MGPHWIPGFNSRSSESHPMNPSKQDSLSAAGGQTGQQRALCPRPPALMTLSAVCGALVLVCVALSMLYHKSDNQPGRKSHVLDYRNLSEHHLITTAANQQLRTQTQHLQQQNTWLIDQNTQLNRTSAGLTVHNRALTSAVLQLQVNQTHLTSTYEMLVRDHGQLVMYVADLENRSRNASQTISSLVRSLAELKAESQTLLDTNAFLRRELLRAHEEGQELMELNSELGAQIENLTARMDEEEAVRREEAEAQSEYDASILAQLQEHNRNLSALLERGASERESARREELAELLSKEEEYRSLDRYCPVVDRNTNERVCKTCPEGWTLFQTTCYYFSSRELTWTASRSSCWTQGGDLLVVNSQQEQAFILDASREPGQKAARLWIGMSDVKEEGHWSWVDGSPVSSDLQFWLTRAGAGSEPDDWRADSPQGEDCGHVDTTKEDLASWMDGACDLNYRWICEKSL